MKERRGIHTGTGAGCCGLEKFVVASPTAVCVNIATCGNSVVGDGFSPGKWFTVCTCVNSGHDLQIHGRLGLPLHTRA